MRNVTHLLRRNRMNINSDYYLKNNLKSLPGSYVLVLQSKNETASSIGRLGILKIMPGYYLYVGSALGPGGVKARVRHHGRIANNPRWQLRLLSLFKEYPKINTSLMGFPSDWTSNPFWKI